MSKLPTKKELIDLATKCLIVNKEVASLKNKTMTRRLKTNLKVDDVFWLREPAKVTNYISRFDSCKIDYQLSADNKKECRIDVPLRFFPNPSRWITHCSGVPNGCIKEMARIFLKVTNVRVERLQDITWEDIIKEGYCISNDISQNTTMTINNSGKGITRGHLKAIEWWVKLWNSTAKAPYRWEDNPMVEVIEYEEIEYSG